MRCSIREDAHNAKATFRLLCEVYGMTVGQTVARVFCTECLDEEASFLQAEGYAFRVEPIVERKPPVSLGPIPECWSVSDVVWPAEEA